MEKILSQFNAENLEIKLTSEKLFINTAASSEVFALRSVNGIGVFDLVDDYNEALTTWKKVRLNKKIFLGAVIIIVIMGLWTMQNSLGKRFSIKLWWFAPVIALILSNNTNNEPKLMSSLRIMMSGGNRDFQFDKTGIKSGNVAEFVAKVESTLTAYHKNND